MRVRSVMRPHPWTIEVQSSIRTALELMEVGGIRHLPVTDDGFLVGIVSDRDLRALRVDLRSARDGTATAAVEEALSQPIGDVMARTVISVSPNATLEDAVQLLRQHVVGALPVIENDHLVGIVSSIDLLAYFGEAAAEDGEGRCVADLMTEQVFSVHPTDSLDVAVAVMLEHGVRHTPVVDEEDAVIGIVSQRDVIGVSGSRSVAEVMHIPETVTPDTLLSDAADILLENSYGCVPVVENRRLVGILTEADFVRRASAC